MKIEKSLEYLKRAKKVTPLATQTLSKGPNYFVKGVSPIFLSHGNKGHVWDLDGNEYVDMILGLCPVTLGYAYPKVNEAIRKQLLSGISFSLPHPLECELAEMLVDIIPCAEMVKFLKTGSEATSAAIRAARAYTGKVGIVQCGYSGWHDWYAIKTDRNMGIPKAMRNFIFEFEYNNIDSLNSAIGNFYGNVAAIIMEPIISTMPNDNFLQQVRDVATANKAVLIFDEIVTGFRISLGGAQEYFGVTPDLATFGKGMANGMPLNCVVGRKDIMKVFEDVFVSSTFGGETLSLAAAVATINEMKTKNTIAYCGEMGKRLMAGMDTMGIRVQGYPQRPMYVLPYDTVEVRTLFMQECIKRSILMHSNALNLCYSHTDRDITQALTAFWEAIDVVEKAVATNSVNEKIEGELIKPAFRRL